MKALLKRFKRDPRNLIGPDVARAPLRTIDLSGTKVTFRCPPQTEAIPLFAGPDQFDIDRDVSVDVHNPKNAYVAVFSSGWVLNDRSISGSPYGGVCVSLGAARTNGLVEAKSFFVLNDFKIWLCDALEKSYGRDNQEMWSNRDHYVEPIIPEHNFWRYPKTKGEIKVESINNVQWCTYETFQPGYSPRVAYETAISHRHALNFSFKPTAYGGLDYFSPEHNVKQASEALIREIMSTVTIQLPPQAQREFDEVANRATSETLKDGTG